MVERLPKLIGTMLEPPRRHLHLFFDEPLTDKHQLELAELVSLQFAGQLRRDPNAPQTSPPQPGDEDAAAERSTPTR